MSDLERVFTEAADLLERDGWFGKWPRFKAGSRCALFALGAAAARDHTTMQPAYDALRSHLGGNVINWNDAPGRTAAEVIDTFRTLALVHASPVAAETLARRASRATVDAESVEA